MATHTTDLTAPTTTVGTSPFTFVIYKDNTSNTFNITPGTASGNYLGYDTSIAFAFSTDANATKYPYDTSLLYALQETTTDHDVTIYFYTAGRTSLTASTPTAYSQNYLQITFHIFQDPTSSLSGNINADGSIRTDNILSTSQLTACYSAKLTSAYNYVRNVKRSTALPAISVDSLAEAGTYNWYIYYATGYNTSVTADSSYLRVSTNSPTLAETDVINYIPVNTAYRIGVRPVCWAEGVEHEGQLYLTDTQYCVAPAPDIDIAHIQNYSNGPYNVNKLKVDTNDNMHPYTNDSLSYIYNIIVVPFTYDTGILLNQSTPSAQDNFTVTSEISTLETNHYSDIVTTANFQHATPTANGLTTFSMILTVNIVNPNVWAGGTLNTFTFGIQYGSNTNSYSAALRRTYNLTPNMTSFIGSTASNPYHLLTATTLSITTENDWHTPPGWCYVPTTDSAWVSGKDYYEYGNGWILRQTAWSSPAGIYERKILSTSPIGTCDYTIILNGNSKTWRSTEANAADSWLDELNVASPIHTWTAVYSNLYSELSTFYSNEDDIKGNKQGTLTCTITTHLGEVFTNTVPFYITLDEAPVVSSFSLQMRTTENNGTTWKALPSSNIYTGEYIRFYFQCNIYNLQSVTVQPQISRDPYTTWTNYGSSQSYNPDSPSNPTSPYRGTVTGYIYYPVQDSSNPQPLGDITNITSCKFRLIVTMTATNKTTTKNLSYIYTPQLSYPATWSDFNGELNLNSNTLTFTSKMLWLGYDSSSVQRAAISYSYATDPDLLPGSGALILSETASAAIKAALISANGRTSTKSNFTSAVPIIYVQPTVTSYLTASGTSFPTFSSGGTTYTPYGNGYRASVGPIIAVACTLNTVAYRRNRIGINVDHFDSTTDDQYAIVKVQGLQTIQRVVFSYLGSNSSGDVGYIDLNDGSDSGYVVGHGFLFDGGTY